MLRVRSCVGTTACPSSSSAPAQPMGTAPQCCEAEPPGKVEIVDAKGGTPLPNLIQVTPPKPVRACHRYQRPMKKGRVAHELGVDDLQRSRPSVSEASEDRNSRRPPQGTTVMYNTSAFGGRPKKKGEKAPGLLAAQNVNLCKVPVSDQLDWR